MKTADAARGKWPEILKRFGLEDHYLRNRHGECPMCGGTDRYRFDDKEGSGSYFCNGCGAGSGFDLVMGITGRPFKEIAAEIDQMVGNIEVQPEKPKTDPAKRIRQTLAGAGEQDGITPVRLYLRNRGLKNCKALRYHPALKYWDNGECIGRWPAMLAIFQQADGSGCTLHVTWLTQAGEKAPVDPVRKFLPPVGSMAGGAIRLTEIYPHIGIAEGIETALAVMARYQIPCWAAGTAGMLESFLPPKGVNHVSIFGDNDATYTGQKAAFALAHRLVIAGYKADVRLPEKVNTDFADMEAMG